MQNSKKRTLMRSGFVVSLIIAAIILSACSSNGYNNNQPAFSEQAITESSVRAALEDLSGLDVVSADEITKIEISSHLGTDNPDDYIVHVYFQPDSIWDEEDALEQAVHTSIAAMEILFENKSIAEVVIWEQLEFTDKYGETEVDTAVRITMTKEVANNIVDWEKVDDRAWSDYNTFFDLAELQFIHPAISKNL